MSGHHGSVAELADALDLESSIERCESSSLSVPTLPVEYNRTVSLTLKVRGKVNA